MKAIVYHKYGTPDALELTEVDKPIPKDDEVLIKVHAVSINDWDSGLPNDLTLSIFSPPLTAVTYKP